VFLVLVNDFVTFIHIAEANSALSIMDPNTRSGDSNSARDKICKMYLFLSEQWISWEHCLFSLDCHLSVSSFFFGENVVFLMESDSL